METETIVKIASVEQLEKRGFTKAAKDLKDLLDRKRKLMLAYEYYKFITPSNVARFNLQLRAKTGTNMDDAWAMQYKMLDFVGIGNYEKVPPESVLQNLEIAQDRKCFDSFEVAYIKDVKDPLLFGRIARCPNRFFIDQWDDDVTIDQLISANEG